MGSNVSIGANFTFNNDADPPNVTATPKSSLDVDTVMAISYPSGVFVKNDGSSFVGTAYTFVTRNLQNQMWMVGSNTKGQLAQNNTTQYSSPVQVTGSSWNKFSMGNLHAWATKTDGTLWAWGDAGGGRLGLNADQSVDISSPTQVPGTTWNGTISAAYVNSYAVKTCLLYTSPSPRDKRQSRMPSSA